MANGIAIGLSLLAGVTFGPVALLLAVPITAILALVSSSRMRSQVALVLLFVMLGAVREMTGPGESGAGLIQESSGARGVIVSIPIASGSSERSLLRLDHLRVAADRWSDATGTVIVYFPEDSNGVSLGDRVTVSWSANDANTLSPGYAAWVRSQGATASARAWSYEIDAEGPAFFEVLSLARRSISDALVGALPGDAGALASGIVTGDDSTMSPAVAEAFRLTGTGHITSVSGQNVALLIGFLSLWLRPSGRTQQFLVHGAMIMVVWTYALMVGLQPPALRAATVATLVIAGAHTGRRPDPLTLLSLTLGAMAMIDPATPRMVGFWLSAAASFALCVVVQPDAPDGVRRQAVNLAMGSMAATVATLPILLATFREWSPIAPVANAVIGPIVTLMFAVSYLFVPIAMFAGPLASSVSWLPGSGLDVVISIVERMGAIAPQVHLDGIGPAGSALVALPCVLLILAFSSETERWMRALERMWTRRGGS